MKRPGSKRGVRPRLAGTALALACAVVPLAGGTAYATAADEKPTAASVPIAASGPGMDWNSEGGWCVRCVPPRPVP